MKKKRGLFEKVQACVTEEGISQDPRNTEGAREAKAVQTKKQLEVALYQFESLSIACGSRKTVRLADRDNFPSHRNSKELALFPEPTNVYH